jgi:hypothetical protein
MSVLIHRYASYKKSRSACISFPKKLARLLGRIEGGTMDDPIIIIGFLCLIAIIAELVLILVIKDIVDNYKMRLAIIGTAELVISPVIVCLVVYGAVPRLYQLPNEVFRILIVSLCVFIILAILTILLVSAYKFGYRYASEVAQATIQEMEQAIEQARKDNDVSYY